MPKITTGMTQYSTCTLIYIISQLEICYKSGWKITTIHAKVMLVSGINGPFDISKWDAMEWYCIKWHIVDVHGANYKPRSRAQYRVYTYYDIIPQPEICYISKRFILHPWWLEVTYLDNLYFASALLLWVKNQWAIRWIEMASRGSICCTLLYKILIAQHNTVQQIVSKTGHQDVYDNFNR